jgi:hypothetical protein
MAVSGGVGLYDCGHESGLCSPVHCREPTPPPGSQSRAQLCRPRLRGRSYAASERNRNGLAISNQLLSRMSDICCCNLDTVFDYVVAIWMQRLTLPSVA